MENLELGAYTRKDKSNIAKYYDMVFDKFPRLKERVKQMAGTLSGGEQQMLAMGRALMALSIANKAYVLETGKIVLQGDAKELLENHAVRSAYLGD
jgi:branched-chain amino acid transport system ATP-binding protein